MDQQRFVRRCFFGVLTAIPLALAGAWCLRETALGLWPLSGVVASLGLYLGLYTYLLLFPLPAALTSLRGSRWKFALTYGLFFLLPYLLFSGATASFHGLGLLQLALYVFLPLALSLSVGEEKLSQWTLRDVLAILLLWLPFDCRLLGEIWLWPTSEGAYPLNTLLAVNVAILVFGVYRRLPGLGLPLAWQKNDLSRLATTSLAFLAVALPVGFITDFITWNPEQNLGKALMTPIGYFLFVAFPEELLFRGLILSYLLHKLPKPWLALTVAAVIFGLSHLNNPPLNDWRYLLLSSLAGIFYGYSFMKSKNLLAPTLVHTLVDSLWVCFFLAPT